MKKILITGAGGFLGARLAGLAAARGYDVRTLSRREWDGPPWVPLVNRFFGELPDGIPDQAFAGGLDAVVHCAASASTNQREADAVNARGTEVIARRSADAGVGAFVLVSSSTADPRSLSAYGRSKYAGEQAVRGIPGLRHVILRPNLIVGAGGGGVYGRMASLVRGLPAVPLLGGGRAIVQPVHVDELCEAILRCIERIGELNGSLLNIGQSGGLPLRAFLGMIARQETGGNKIMIPVPLAPVALLVRGAEALGMRLPVSTANLQGLRQIQRVDTAPDLARLGLTLRPAGDLGAGPMLPEPVAAGCRPVRVLLVGGGRIGLIHAINLGRLPGMVLAGLVDPSPGAVGLLRGMGIAPPSWRSLPEALAAARFDAAIVATPPSTHLPLATACLEHGLAVLVEKPLAPDAERSESVLALEHGFPGRLMGGYVIPRTPHIAWWAGRLQRGELGRITGFHGISLLSYMLTPGMKTWQANPAVSGGGVLMNPGVHVLSMLWAACGRPSAIRRAETLCVHSRDVEDSLAVELEYPGFTGTIHASWSIEGFPRPEHHLTIRTDRGVLTLSGSTGIFVPADGPAECRHQLDAPGSFNLAPDFAGAGFVAGLQELARRARGEPGAPTGLDLAATADFERTVFAIYRQGGRATALTIPVEAGHVSHQQGRTAGVLVDLRDLPVDPSLAARLAAGPGAASPGYEISSAQARRLLRAGSGNESIRVTAPDFLDHSRLLLSGRPLELVRRLGAGGTFAAVRAAVAPVIRDRAASFWAAASALLAADLRGLPRGFNGTVLLHSALVDLAVALRRLDRLGEWVVACRSAAPAARIGIHSQLPREAAAAAALLSAPLDEISCVLSPGMPGRGEVGRALHRAAPRLVAEVGVAPAAVHRLAAADAGRWRGDADALLVHAAVDPGLAQALRADLRPRWNAAFPGIGEPDLWS